MKTTDYLDAVKRRLKLPSDYKLGVALGLTRSAVSAYRSKGVTLGADTARQVAAILGLEADAVLADMELERATPRAARRSPRRPRPQAAA